jgi:hypothetical protein
MTRHSQQGFGGLCCQRHGQAVGLAGVELPRCHSRVNGGPTSRNRNGKTMPTTISIRTATLCILPISGAGIVTYFDPCKSVWPRGTPTVIIENNGKSQTIRAATRQAFQMRRNRQCPMNENSPATPDFPVSQELLALLRLQDRGLGLAISRTIAARSFIVPTSPLVRVSP